MTAGKNTSRNLVIFTIIASWALIFALVFIGDTSNSLHTSALSWAFFLNISVIFGYIFGIQFLPDYMSFKSLKAPEKHS